MAVSTLSIISVLGTLLAVASAQGNGTANATYPAIAGANCTLTSVGLPATQIPNVLNGVVFLSGNAALLNISAVCLSSAQQNLINCQADIARVEGCCDAACATALGSIISNPATANCQPALLDALCKVQANPSLVPAEQVANLAVVFTQLSSLQKRCITGTDYVCPTVANATNSTTPTVPSVNSTTPTTPNTTNTTLTPPPTVNVTLSPPATNATNTTLTPPPAVNVTLSPPPAANVTRSPPPAVANATLSPPAVLPSPPALNSTRVPAPPPPAPPSSASMSAVTSSLLALCMLLAVLLA